MAESIILDTSRPQRALSDFEPEQVAPVALKAFFALVDAWDLDRSEARVLLGSPSERTYYRWRDGKVASLSADTLERISLLLGIYKALHILLPDRAQADGYLKRPNKAFGGASALEVMMRGRMEHLYRVRRYLDAWRG